LTVSIFHRIAGEALELAGRLSGGECRGGDTPERQTRFDSLCKAGSLAIAGLIGSNAAAASLQRLTNYYYVLLNEAGTVVEQSRVLVRSSEALKVADSYTDRLASLCVQFYLYCPLGPPADRLAFSAFSRLFIRRLQPEFKTVHELLQSPAIDAELAALLNTYLQHMEGSGCGLRQTHQALFYFAGWLNRLVAISGHPPHRFNQLLLQELIHCNFNYLPFISYWQMRRRRSCRELSPDRQEEHLAACLAELKPGLLPDIPAYDSRWPSAGIMLTGWLNEEIAGLKSPVPVGHSHLKPPEKLPLGVSVAHLACFLKFFHEEAVTQLSAADLIRWATSRFSAKRQSEISARGLAKAFYSIDQFTAARVRETLLRMAARITARYFPAMVGVMLSIDALRAMPLILPASGS
jgi:hypothetical protein